MDVKVHPRVMRRHPELAEEGVLSAWGNAYWYRIRHGEDKQFHVAIGSDVKSRFVELIAVEDDDGALVIFHAITPPTKKTMLELGITRR